MMRTARMRIRERERESVGKRVDGGGVSSQSNIHEFIKMIFIEWKVLA